MKLEDFLTKEEGDDSRRLPDGRYASTWDKLGRCWNIGCGVTIGVTKDTVWTAEELRQHEEAELASVVAGVAKLVKVPLGENRRTVLESFAYNCGLGALSHSSILKSVNEGHFDAVPSELRQYVHAKGASGPVPGLVNRRNDEIRLWNQPDSIPTSITTPKNVPQAFTQETKPMATTSPAPTPSAIVNANPVVAAAVQTSTISLSSIWSSITGMFSSVAFGGIGAAVSALAPNLTIEVLAGLGVLAAIVSAIAHLYALITKVNASNNATITLAENFLNQVDVALGGKGFSFDNAAPATASLATA